MATPRIRLAGALTALHQRPGGENPPLAALLASTDSPFAQFEGVVVLG